MKANGRVQPDAVQQSLPVLSVLVTAVMSIQESVVPLTPSGRKWPVAVCAAQQIMYSTLPNSTGSNGFHCGLLNFKLL
jgi:hypothetical protein